jgi:hypothetical protein
MQGQSKRARSPRGDTMSDEITTLATLEEYSASSGDYFTQPDDEPLTDSEGNPMVLVVKTTDYVDVSEV